MARRLIGVICVNVKEAINFIIESNDVQWNTENKQAIEAMRIALDVLGKHEHYQWHDLRKDPTDLPECDDMVYVYGYSFLEKEYMMDRYFEGYGWQCSEIADIIAWKYIEPFEDQ